MVVTGAVGLVNCEQKACQTKTTRKTRFYAQRRKRSHHKCAYAHQSRQKSREALERRRERKFVLRTRTWCRTMRQTSRGTPHACLTAQTISEVCAGRPGKCSRLVSAGASA